MSRGGAGLRAAYPGGTDRRPPVSCQKWDQSMFGRQSLVTLVILGCLVLLALAGCRGVRQIRDPEYAEVLNRAAQAAVAAEPGPAAVPPPGVLTGPQPVEAYIALALAQNPDIQAARKRVDALANRVPQAASLNDPMFGVTVFPAPIQTAAGQQDVALTASQQLPWPGKLRRRAEAAEAETDVARAQLAAVELEVIEQVKRAYYELYFIDRAIEITEKDRELLVQFTRIAESKYRTGETSQQDVLRAQVEVLNIDNELIRLRQQHDSAQARLARLLHVSPETPLRPLAELPEEQLPAELEALYELAIQARPELHAELAAIRRDRVQVELAQLDYFPDLTAGATWIEVGDAGLSPVANGEDAVLLGFSVNLPIYRRRLDAAVREAEARMVSTARRYDSLRDRTAEAVKDLYAQAISQYELVRLFREEIIPKAQQTLDVSTSAYQVGDVDFLQLIDNWQQLLRFEITRYRLESQFQRTLASLERIVGGELPVRPRPVAPPAPQG
ncbi:MAG TPA: TolC family protein, partial [Planctomycetaceae bacterium]|nr:TolC family protein [Planctomycetaceae bacterium]